MKPITATYTSAPSSARNSRTPRRSSPYLSATQTKALLATSLAARTARLSAGDMITTDQAAELASTSRVTINAWITKGRAIGLTQTRRGFRMPSWQFEPTMWDAIPQLAKALETTQGWTLLSFLETPNGGLDGRTPRIAIEQGDVDRVLKLAGAEGT